MGSIGPAEIFVVLIVALVVLGPNRLPDAARSVGKAMAELRKMTSGVQAEVRDAFSEPPTYPTPKTTPDVSKPEGSKPDGSKPDLSKHSPPSSPEQADITVVREPDPPPSA